MCFFKSNTIFIMDIYTSFKFIKYTRIKENNKDIINWLRWLDMHNCNCLFYCTMIRHAQFGGWISKICAQTKLGRNKFAMQKWKLIGRN